MKHPFDDLYLIRQLCHGSKRLSDSFPKLTIGVHSSNLFSNLIFSLAVDNIDKKDNFGSVMNSVIGEMRSVWNLSGAKNSPNTDVIIVPIELFYHMIPDPDVRDWLLQMEDREKLEDL